MINGAIDSFNQCFGACTGLDNFWRSVSNLTLNIVLPKSHPAYAPAPPEDPGCANTNDLYAISQAAPIRRVHINGLLFLFDYCNTGFTSGGFIADSEFSQHCHQRHAAAVPGPQQPARRRLVQRRLEPGLLRRRGQRPPSASRAQPYTTLATSPVTREAPFLYQDAAGSYNVFAPSAQQNSVGPVVVERTDAGHLAADRQLLHRAAV